MKRLLATALIFLPLAAHAVTPGEMLADPALEARARVITGELRCLVCQNQSIDDSDAALAKDLRMLVREKLKEGLSDAQVRDYVHARYGDFVLLRPPLNSGTLLLWAAPALALLAGGQALRAIEWTSPAGEPIRVALLQGNVPQNLKFADGGMALSEAAYLPLLAEAAQADLVVLPESVLPLPLSYLPQPTIDALADVPRRGAALIFGIFIEEPRGHFYNSAVGLAPGSTMQRYSKRHLVPFGEFIPLKRLLFFVTPLVESVSDFSPGTEYVVMPLEGHRLSTAICYEVVYPDLVAAFVGRGSQLLTTITNDAWYGHSSAPHQHFWMATLRAVEQGRYLVRSANTGISGIVDPYGRVVVKTPIFEQTVAVGDVRYLDGRTLYSRTGDAFAYACLAATLMAWWASRRR